MGGLAVSQVVGWIDDRGSRTFSFAVTRHSSSSVRSITRQATTAHGETLSRSAHTWSTQSPSQCSAALAWYCRLQASLARESFL